MIASKKTEKRNIKKIGKGDDNGSVTSESSRKKRCLRTKVRKKMDEITSDTKYQTSVETDCSCKRTIGEVNEEPDLRSDVTK